LGNVYEPEFVQVTMKMRDIVTIQEDSRLRASPRHGGAWRFFSLFSNQSDDGAIKKLITTQEIDEKHSRRNSRNKKRMGAKGCSPHTASPSGGERGSPSWLQQRISELPRKRGS
jgi:hypothetical protein